MEDYRLHHKDADEEWLCHFSLLLSSSSSPWLAAAAQIMAQLGLVSPTPSQAANSRRGHWQRWNCCWPNRPLWLKISVLPKKYSCLLCSALLHVPVRARQDMKVE